MDWKTELDPASWLLMAKDIHKVVLLIAERIRRDFCRLSQEKCKTEFTDEEVPFFHLGGVFWLNAGLVLENLLKGIVIKNNHTLITKDGLDPKVLTHNLIKLSRMADFAITPVEGYFLWVAKECVIWAGRYPSSRKGDKTKPPVFSMADVSVYLHIHERLLEEYKDIPEKRWRFHRLHRPDCRPTEEL